MRLRLNTYIQIPAVTFVKRKPFFCAVSDIILDSIVKSFRQFGDTFTFKIDQSVNSFYLSKKDTVLFRKTD